MNLCPAPAPDWLLPLAVDVAEPKGSQGKERKKRSIKKDYALVLEGLSEGERDDAIFKFVCSRLALGLSAEEIKILVCEAARNCTPPFSEAEALKKVARGLARYGTRQRFNRTDMGNAQRMANLYGDRIRYCKHLGWMYYDGKRWIADDLAMIQTLAKETIRSIYAEAATIQDEEERKALGSFAMKCESASRIEAMVRLLPSEPEISVSHTAFDADKWLLNCLNGTLDLRTGKLRPHDPADLITKLAPATYDPAAQGPRWEKFLTEIMGGDSELTAFLQRFSGYGLTGDVSEQVWGYLHGKGANGKSTYLRVLQSILGDYALTTPPETFLKKSSGGGINNDLARLKGARLVVANEPPDGGRFDPGVLKIFSGEDSITARFLHREYFEFVPEGKLIFCANKRLSVPDNSEGFWRRPLLIPFQREFKGRDKDAKLTGKLQAEASGILNWMVAGCLAWQREGLTPPTIVQDAVAEYRNENDILGDFVENHCETGPGESVAVSDLYSAYSSYAENNNIRRPLSRQKFNEDLNSRAGISRNRAPITRIQIWKGIGLVARAADNVLPGNFRRTEDNAQTCSTCDFQGSPCPQKWRDGNADNCNSYKGI